MNNRRYAPWLLLPIGVVLGVAGDLLIGPNRPPLDTTIQIALIGLIGVMAVADIGAAGAFVGATLGADAARESADQRGSRPEVRAVRLADEDLHVWE